MNPREYAKAYLAAAIAFLGSLAGALDDNSITAAEWITVITVALLALGGVSQIPNKPAPKNHTGLDREL